MMTASNAAAASASMLRAAACEVLMLSFPPPATASVHPVKREGAAGQNAALGRRRRALQPLAHHVGRPREEAVLMRVVGRPHDLVGADIVGQHGDRTLDRLERDPAVA